MKHRLHKNEYTLQHSDSVKKAINSFRVSSISYYPENYNSTLYNKLATFHEISEKNIFIGSGLEHVIIRLLLQVRIKLNIDQALLPTLSWNYYEKMLDCCLIKKSQYFQTEKRKIHFRYNIKDLNEKLYSLSPSFVIIASPNNPTGHSISSLKLQQIIKSHPNHIFFIDETYHGFGEEPYKHSTLTNLCNTQPNLIVGRSFSKFFGLAGLRCGYAIMNKDLRHQLSIEPYYLGINILSEKVALAALNNYKFYNEQAQKIKRTRILFSSSINKMKGIKTYKSQANFILIELEDGEKTQQLHKYLYQNGFNVKVFDTDNMRKYLRISIGKSTLMKNLLNLIKNFNN